MVNVARLDGLLGIGEVLQALREEFPDISVSKVRFLESEQLLTPVRTPGGYRKFSQADVERLRYILCAQRDRYLPLRVIRDELDAIDRGLQPTVADTAAVRVPRALVVAADAREAESDVHSGLRVTREELLRDTGIDERLLQTIEQYGLIAVDDDGYFDVHALRICHCAQELTSYGIEPRHLRQFKVAADREAGLVTAAVTPHLRRPGADSRARAQDMAREVAALVLLLHSSLLQSALRDSVDS